jgi:type I restriction enzyme S subunit
MSESNGSLPEGWTRTTLGEIGRYHNGRGFKKTEWSTTGRPIIRIQNLTDPSKPFNLFSGAADPRHEVKQGDLLVSWAATLGVFRWDGPDAVLNQHIFRVESWINPDFHYYLLRNVLDALYAQSHGSGMVHITKGRFDATPVVLPPEDVQVELVQQLDQDLAAASAGTQSFGRALAALPSFRSAVIRDALAGSWPQRPLQEVLISLRNGLFVSRPAEGPPGIPIYRISAVRPMALNAEDIRYAPADTADHERFLVQPGDVLFTRYSGNAEYVGACAAVPGGTAPALHPDKLIRAVVDREVMDPYFLELACSGGTTWEQIRANRKTTAGQVGIAGGQLAQVLVPIPPLDAQQEIVATCQKQLDAGNQLRARTEQLMSTTFDLERSILHHALRPPQSTRANKGHAVRSGA